MYKVLISGGGTGGHIFPAIAIAKELERQLPEVKIKFGGAKGKMEMQKVPQAGYEIEGLWISGFRRKRSLTNLLLPFKLIFSVIKSLLIILKFKPDVVIGVGGYASGPLLFVANILGKYTAIQEQNSYPGITNKMLSKSADRIYVAFPRMDRFFPNEKIVRCGNPVRSVFLKPIDQKASRTKFGLDPNKRTVLVFGGSLGARSLNQSMTNASKEIKSQKDVQWIWQIGKGNYDNFINSETANLENVTPLQFITEMEAAYSAANIVVCRAGALTLAELAVVGKAAILVPSPNVSEDHQTKNAMALVEQGAALICPDQRIRDDMFPLAMDLISNKESIADLENSIANFSSPDAARNIVSHILKNGSDE